MSVWPAPLQRRHAVVSVGSVDMIQCLSYVNTKLIVISIWYTEQVFKRIYCPAEKVAHPSDSILRGLGISH
jgi:hypothetical protein